MENIQFLILSQDTHLVRQIQSITEKLQNTAKLVSHETALDLISNNSASCYIILFIDLDTVTNYTDLLSVCTVCELSYTFFLFSSKKNFSQVFQGLHLHAEDFFIKPIEEDILHQSVLNVYKQYMESSYQYPWEKNQTIRGYFAKKVLPELKEQSLSTHAINQLYGTNFSDGFFRMIFIKIDKSSLTPADDFSTSYYFIQTLQQHFIQVFKLYCNDIVFDIKDDGIMALINYTPSENAKILELINVYFATISNIRENSFSITVCVGNSVDDPCQAEDSADQARFAEWTRLAVGTNRIIYSDQIKQDTFSLLNERYCQIKAAIEKDLNTLNGQSFVTHIQEMFQLPTALLSRYETMVFFRTTLDSFFEINKNSFSTIKVDEMQRLVRNIQHKAASFQDFQSIFLSEIVPLINMAIDNINQQHSPAIRQALKYMEDNYTKAITLNDVAYHVKLNPVYLSSLFKKETGQNFINYLTDLRVLHSKDLLVNSTYNITEIANTVGFHDSRYFSKIFRKITGLTPSQYRKKHTTVY